MASIFHSINEIKNKIAKLNGDLESIQQNESMSEVQRNYEASKVIKLKNANEALLKQLEIDFSLSGVTHG